MRLKADNFVICALVVTATVGLLSLTARVQAQNPDEMMPAESAAKARSLLQQTIEALGGTAYLNVHNSDCSGRYAQFQHSGDVGGYIEIRQYRELPDKERLEYGPKGNIVIIYAGDKGWNLDRGGVSDATTTDIAEYQEQLKMQMGNVLRNRMRDSNLVFRYAGTDVVDLKEADWVEIGDSNDQSLRIAIGRSDHLPIRSVLTERDPKTGEKFERATYYTSYHLIDAIQTPFRESRFLNGRQTYQVFLDSCSYNVQLPPDFFTRNSLEQRFAQSQKKKK